MASKSGMFEAPRWAPEKGFQSHLFLRFGTKFGLSSPGQHSNWALGYETPFLRCLAAVFLLAWIIHAQNLIFLVKFYPVLLKREGFHTHTHVYFVSAKRVHGLQGKQSRSVRKSPKVSPTEPGPLQVQPSRWSGVTSYTRERFGPLSRNKKGCDKSALRKMRLKKKKPHRKMTTNPQVFLCKELCVPV